MNAERQRKLDRQLIADVKLAIALRESIAKLHDDLAPAQAYLDAEDEAQREGRWFVCFDHPLLPGWKLQVNDPETRSLESAESYHSTLPFFVRASTARRGTRHRS